MQPTPSLKSEMDQRKTASVRPTTTSTMQLRGLMNPAVILHRNPILDALNEERNFREIEKKMEEIHKNQST